MKTTTETKASKGSRGIQSRLVPMLGIGIVVLITIILFNYQQEKYSAILEQKDTKISELKKQYSSLQDKYASNMTEVINKNKRLSCDVDDQNKTIKSLNSQLKELGDNNKDILKELKEYKNREELYNKYEYAIEYEGERTDLTYKEIKYGEEKMQEENLDPDLLFGIIMVESRGTRTAKNKESTATGYGQVLAGTGKYLYEDVMGNGKGTYDHSYAYDGKTNINMVSTYLGYLCDNKSSLFGAVKQYCGRDDAGTQSYLNCINSFTGTKDKYFN